MRVVCCGGATPRSLPLVSKGVLAAFSSLCGLTKWVVQSGQRRGFKNSVRAKNGDLAKTSLC